MSAASNQNPAASAAGAHSSRLPCADDGSSPVAPMATRARTAARAYEYSPMESIGDCIKLCLIP